jgi:hypothetical protein
VTLLLQVIAVLVVAAVAHALIGGDRRPRLDAAAVTVVAVILVGFAALDTAWSTARSLLHERPVDAKLGPAGYLGQGGAVFSAREDFLSLVDTRVPRRAPVYLVCGCTDERDWISWRLSPRPFTDGPLDADWIVFYRAPPKDADVPASAYGPLVRLGPDFALARVRR